MNPWHLLLTLLSLGQTSAWSYQYIMSLIVPIKAIMNAQELVWFISRELEPQHVAQIETFIPIFGAALDVTQTVVTNNTKMRMKSAPARRVHVSIVFTTGVQDPIMEVFRQVLLGRHFLLAVVTMVDRLDDMQPVYEFCEFLYEHQFFNTMLYYQNAEGKNRLYGSVKFPVKECENRTDYWALMRRKQKTKGIDPMGATDVGGYSFPTPMRQHMPYLFKFRDRYGESQHEGTTYGLVEIFVRTINASMKELLMPPDAKGGNAVNMKQVLQLIRDRRIEFAAHAYALFLPDDGLDQSYPLNVVQWCLMVPLYNSISTYFYPLLPFSPMVWFVTAASCLALILLELLWLFLFDTGAVSDVVLNTYCYLINIGPPQPIFQPVPLRFFLQLAVFFFGFFISANYTSTLGSLLTVNLFEAQISTLEDIVRVQLPVMIIDYELEFLQSLGGYNELPFAFTNLLRPVDSNTFAQHQSKFNRSYAYFVTDDYWRFLDEQQNHLQTKLFKFSQICFGSYHLAFPMQMDSFIWRDMRYFTSRIHSSGILSYFERSCFQSALYGKLVERFQESKEYTSVGMDHLTVAYILLLVFCVLAGIIFVVELLMGQRTAVRAKKAALVRID